MLRPLPISAISSLITKKINAKYCTEHATITIAEYEFSQIYDELTIKSK